MLQLTPSFRMRIEERVAHQNHVLGSTLHKSRADGAAGSVVLELLLRQRLPKLLAQIHPRSFLKTQLPRFLLKPMEADRMKKILLSQFSL